MNCLEMEQLLKRYLASETSLAEEKQLKDAFSQADIPAHLAVYKHYFSYVSQEQKIGHPQKNFDAELSEKLSAQRNLILLSPKLLAYAAGFLLLMSSLFFLTKNENVEAQTYKPLSAKEIKVAKKYLGLLAQNLEQSASISSQNLEKLKLLSLGQNTLQQYETLYTKQFHYLYKIEQFDQSFDQLKYLKAFEKSKIKL